MLTCAMATHILHPAQSPQLPACCRRGCHIRELLEQEWVFLQHKLGFKVIQWRVLLMRIGSIPGGLSGVG